MNEAWEKLCQNIYNVIRDNEELIAENSRLKAENKELKQMIAGNFDPDKYVNVYNELMAEESKINASGFEPHENI